MSKRTWWRPGHALARAAVLALGMVLMSGTAHALEYSGVGGKLGYSSPEDRDGTAQVGVHAELEQRGTRLAVEPNAMYWKVNGMRDLSSNLDLYYHFDRDGKVTPYVGGGLGLNFFRDENLDRSDTEVGMNVLGGVRFPGTKNHYFVEGRYTATDIPQVALLGGITFHNR